MARAERVPHSDGMPSMPYALKEIAANMEAALNCSKPV
jgi:hypothetical protein